MDIEQLKKSSKAVGQLVPVLKDKHGKIIDGYHRKRADINWKEVTLDWVDTEVDLITVRLAANWFRRIPTPKEKTDWLRDLCYENKEEWKGHYSSCIVERFKGAVSIDTIERYLPPEYKQKRERRIPPLESSKGKEHAKQWLVKYGREVFPKWYDKHPQAADVDREFSKFRYNVWEAKPKRPEDCGDASFHGNTSPEVVRETIVRYARNKSDLVLDNMAGSGTILDMCKKLNRECLSFDLSPTRPEIKQADARHLPLPDNYVDFAFSHFPYGDMERYSDLQGDLSTMSPKQFLEESKKVMAEVYRVLKRGGYYMVLIGDQRKDKKVIDWSAEFSIMGRDIFKLHDKIIWYAKGQTSYRGNSKYAQIAAEHNFCLPTFDTLLVFKK